ncbi:NAD(P)-binding Rossmann-fold superfamily protein [Striga hermonthica]|uniref:NAD(P)-binding Rossmann-fold superfamily protein n=1 Tax=Striga hermonthica TaxID=68872 RepID=A0A9N7RLT8_STRHE|nr:NAD(P)-binding Rossmann-fold superfamily protein [Striga hermonthica]
MNTTKFCTTSCFQFAGFSQRPKNSNFSHLSFNSATLFIPIDGKFFVPCRRSRCTASHWMSTPAFIVKASSTTGTANDEVEASSKGVVGVDDLLIVGPGVLGRIVAQQWKKEHPRSQIYGQTLTIDHHDELKETGIVPFLKGTQVAHKFPNVIFCAPPSRNPDYLGEVREGTLKWNREGSFLFTSSSALYDCHDNGSCDENTPVVPTGRNPKLDTLLNVEKLVLEAGGCVC